MSEETHSPGLARHGETHLGRKPIQPLRAELRTFHQQAKADLHYPVLWWESPDRQLIADALGQVVKTQGLTCWACAILADHIHLLIRKHRLKYEGMLPLFKDAGQTEIIKSGNAPLGHPVFSEDRCNVYKSTPQEIRSCIRYINQNYTKHRISPPTCPYITEYDGWPYTI